MHTKSFVGLQRVLLLCLLLCYPLSLVIPLAWSWENGIIENAQVVVLLAGLVLAGRAWLRGPRDGAAMLGLCAVPVWFLLASRELSWGAVFLPPLGFGPEGPVFSSRVLPYRPLVPAIAGLLVLASFVTGWRHGVHRYLKRVIVGGGFPWMCVLVVLGAALGSTFGEGHVPAFARDWVAHSQVLEELCELVGYVALVLAQGVVLGYKAPVKASKRAAETV
ncbi:hypothetical protein LK540_20925 [Massilia sp. IC2-278]|uniref:hypothetical protein n=1 Tax=Massilia sp. IC2-278 TaxID=2887200 RepID=UPI001E451320|nr:hypothetical protein [Massilia sp. IC2-278]MCC2962901.1 hypothetical protein [Massilia sp. IC2-278]